MSACVTAAALWAVPVAGVACVGDCNDDVTVSIDELVRGVRIALGEAAVGECDAIDNDRDGAVQVNELVLAVGKALDGCALGPADEVLLNTAGTQLVEYALGSGASMVLVEPLSALPKGQSCLLPGGSGNFVVGDTGRLPAEAPGWAIFSPDGTFLQALSIPVGETETRMADPVGCAVDGQGRLFGTARFDGGGGQLVVYFPPDYASSCILDPLADQGTREPGTLAVDDDGTLTVPETQSGSPAVLPGRVLRFAPPFPNSAAECATTHPTSSTFVEYEDAVPSIGIARGHDGHFFVGIAQSDAGTGIREHAADGTLVREVVAPGSGGSPQALAVDSTGSLYYSEGPAAAGLPSGTAAAWTVRRITFDAADAPGAPELIDSGAGAPTGLAVVPSRADEWLTLGGSLRRTFFNPRERQINPQTATRLTLKWRYQTSGMISAQAAVTWLDLPSEGRTQVVIVPSWDQYVYALRAENGSRVWSYKMKPQPGAFYPYSGSPTVAWVDGQQRVFVPGGETMYCLDATTGAEVWQTPFDAGTGCTTCMVRQERGEIESSPAVVNGLVISGMDTNDGVPGKGGMFALSAADGRLVWWFDLVTQATCRPLPEDNVRRFDGFHSEAELGLPEGFFKTRPGCDFDRTQNACGNVWSSAAVDARRGMLYTVSANCDTDDDPSTPPPPPPPPRFEEAIFALNLDGTPAWVWRPREVDPDDFDFGAVPNLFQAEIDGSVREVVGVGGKDGTYYVLDRDGVNEITGRVEPYWQTNVVPGGPAGGMIGSASVGDGRIVVATAPGLSVFEPQKPIVHAFDVNTGRVLWQYSDVDASFGPTMGVPGLAFTCSTPRPNINIFSRDDGRLVRPLAASNVISGIASGPAIVSGSLYVGGGTGAHNSGADAEGEAVRDTPLSAFCVRGAPGCTPNTCNDGNVCTYDYPDASGTCVSQPSAEDLDCVSGSMRGKCHNGTCMAAPSVTPTPGEG